MDTSENNRYQLLFIDDESGGYPGRAGTSASKENESTSSGSKKLATSGKRNVEKENKSGTLNKNGNDRKNVYAKTEQFGTMLNKNSVEGVPLRATSKPQNNEIQEQRNFRDCEFRQQQQEPRQPRDRDARGALRNRESAFRCGKREFDRQSGSDKTGVKSVDKREGAGAHNWGSVKQEINDINKSTIDTETIDKVESSNEQIFEQLSAQEEEVRELTLDEWKALRGERIKPQYNIRKPNEDEDNSEWKKMVVLNKKKEGDIEEEYEYDPSMYPQRVGRLQRIVNIQFNFNDGRRSGGGFGRGRGRGHRTVDETKGALIEGDRLPRKQRNVSERKQKFSKPNVLKVDDERHFPTLN